MTECDEQGQTKYPYSTDKIHPFYFCSYVLTITVLKGNGNTQVLVKGESD